MHRRNNTWLWSTFIHRNFYNGLLIYPNFAYRFPYILNQKIEKLVSKFYLGLNRGAKRIVTPGCYILTALLLRAEARELLPQKTPRPRDLGSHPRGARQSDPHARGANQKPGGPLTALSLRARDSGAPPATLPRPSGSGSHASGLGKQPPSERKGREGDGQKSREDPRPPSRSVRRLRGSSCTQNKDKRPEPVTVQGFKGWAPRGLDSRPRAEESGTTTSEPV